MCLSFVFESSADQDSLCQIVPKNTFLCFGLVYISAFARAVQVYEKSANHEQLLYGKFFVVAGCLLYHLYCVNGETCVW